MNLDNLEKVWEELPYDTNRVDIEEDVNDEFDDDNRIDFIEENETLVNDEDEDSTEIEEEKEN